MIIGTAKVIYPYSVHTRDSANIYGRDLGKDLQPNAIFDVIAKSAPTSTLFPNSTLDIWLQLSDLSWTCMYYKFTGKTFCSFTPNTPSVTPAIPIKETITLDDGTVWTATSFTKM